MKRNVIYSFVLSSALALASCSSTNKLASTSRLDDDVYDTRAEAGDRPEYVQNISDDERFTDTYTDQDDDDYYYNSYSALINRFNYASPFSSYYDGYYYGYEPYGSNGYSNDFYNGYYSGYTPYYAGFGYGFGSPYYGFGGFGYPYGGFGFGIGFGFGSPYYGYGLGYPYGYGYSSYYGGGYGYGNHWGIYSASNVYGGNGRPARGGYTPRGNQLSINGIGRNGAPSVSFTPGRASRIYNNQGGNVPTRTGYSRMYGNYGNRTDNNGNATRQQQGFRPIERPAFTPQNNSGMGRSSGGGFSGGGGGGRPGRP